MQAVKTWNTPGQQLLCPESRDDDELEGIDVDWTDDHGVPQDNAMVRNPPDCGRLRTAASTLARKPRAGPSGLPGVVDRDVGLVSSGRQASDVLDEVAQGLGLIKQVRRVPLDQGFLIVGHRTGASQNQNRS